MVSLLLFATTKSTFIHRQKCRSRDFTSGKKCKFLSFRASMVSFIHSTRRKLLYLVRVMSSANGNTGALIHVTGS